MTLASHARSGGWNVGTANSSQRSGIQDELEEMYVCEQGRVLLSGTQALVRLTIDQRRADRRRGLRTATLVSGYPGSPLGGLDQEFARRRELVAAHDIVMVPGLNEELAATAVWGSQLATGIAGARFDGVLGLWFGKAPGLDRAGDAFRHGNHIGVARSGGVVAAVGDDPAAKSSTLPSASEQALADLGIPTLQPGSVQEVLDYGLHGFALSRASGLWCALKIVADVADATAVIEVSGDRVHPRPPLAGADVLRYAHRPTGQLVPPHCLKLEQSLVGPRTELALGYARANDLNSITVATPDAWLGRVSKGLTSCCEAGE